jgi:uncharacterized protein (TIGR02118 family)
MIKLVYCLRKRADVPAAEFHRYWLEQHGPAVRSFAKAIGGKKYIQSHTILPELNEAFRASRDLAPAYDGITEVWYDNAEALSAGMQTAEGRAAHKALLEDESKFIDFEQSCVFMTQEHVIFDY